MKMKIQLTYYIKATQLKSQSWIIKVSWMFCFDLFKSTTCAEVVTCQNKFKINFPIKTDKVNLFVVLHLANLAPSEAHVELRLIQ